MPHSPPNNNTCFSMWQKSHCNNKECRFEHGNSAENTPAECAKFKQHRWCYYLWSPSGCNRNHGREKNA
jgi:hypothetical protein